MKIAEAHEQVPTVTPPPGSQLWNVPSTPQKRHNSLVIIYISYLVKIPRHCGISYCVNFLTCKSSFNLKNTTDVKKPSEDNLNKDEKYSEIRAIWIGYLGA